MIKGFEDFTDDLSDYERDTVIDALREVLLSTERFGSSGAITNSMIKEFLEIRSIKTSAPRIRHMIHILRVSDAVPRLVATSNGYYMSNKKEELEDYKQSLDDRLRSIYQVRRAIKRQIIAMNHQQAYQQKLF